MSKEAIPILAAESKTNIEEIKQRSIEEKKQCHLRYRGNLFWAGIKSQEDLDKKYLEAVEDYKNGDFFLERMGRWREVDPPLTMVLLFQRKQWIKEYDIRTIPEFMLIDMALIDYFHAIRLNETICNIMSSIEWDYFAQDAPRFQSTNFWGTRKPYSKDNDKAVAEELAYRLKETLQPVLDQYNRMFIRNLKALRDLKRGNIQLKIGNVGQMNIGDKQINIEKGGGSSGK